MYETVFLRDVTTQCARAVLELKLLQFILLLKFIFCVSHVYRMCAYVRTCRCIYLLVQFLDLMPLSSFLNPCGVKNICVNQSESKGIKVNHQLLISVMRTDGNLKLKQFAEGL